MKAVVIGGAGHIGSYLCPLLVREGYEVTAVQRGTRQPYSADRGEWKQVRMVQADCRALEEEGKFGAFIAGLEPDIICDLICYRSPQARALLESVAGRIRHYLCIGSIWIYQYNLYVPVQEGHPRNATDPYGAGKAALEEYLREAARQGLPATMIHPGHIVGRGWVPLNPQANFNIGVYRDIAAGREIALPDRGTATVHHVHAEDIAALMLACLRDPGTSAGQAYHAASPAAATLRGLAEGLYARYGHEPKIRYVPLDELVGELSEKDGAATAEHVTRSPAVSMEKARRQLDFTPRHTSLQAVEDALDHLERAGEIF